MSFLFLSWAFQSLLPWQLSLLIFLFSLIFIARERFSVLAMFESVPKDAFRGWRWSFLPLASDYEGLSFLILSLLFQKFMLESAQGTLFLNYFPPTSLVWLAFVLLIDDVHLEAASITYGFSQVHLCFMLITCWVSWPTVGFADFVSYSFGSLLGIIYFTLIIFDFLISIIAFKLLESLN